MVINILDAIPSRMERPTVTVTYAQSIDGCLAAVPGTPTALSGPESIQMTHALRARHDAILVGVGTVLSDDPQLTTRIVDGPDPQPIVLDSRLRTPLSARLLDHPTRSVWVATGEAAPPEKAEKLRASGADLISIQGSSPLDLNRVLEELQARGVQRIMVEGGAEVITSFLRARLADLVVITIAPYLIGAGGLRAPGPIERLTLKNPHYEQLGTDMVVWGKPV